jgi:hypothetical protein
VPGGLPGDDSERVAAARRRARERLDRQRRTLRPLGVAGTVLVALSAASGHPTPALHGKGLGGDDRARRVHCRPRHRPG